MEQPNLNNRDRHRVETGQTDGPGSTERTSMNAGAAGSTMEPPTTRSTSKSFTPARQTSQSTDSTTDRAKSKASETADKARDVAHTATDKARDKASELAGMASDKLSDAKATASRAADTAKEKVDLPGPVLTSVLGALGGALGGYWLGRSEPDEKSGFTDKDEAHYRTHFEANSRPGIAYGEARTGYLLGHMAARNPDYDGRDFEQVEPELRQGFHGEHLRRWDSVREYARHAYERRTGGVTPALLGALAGALGGWWAANATDSATKMPDEEDKAYRAHFASVKPRPDGMTYDQARGGYTLGYLAACNPTYKGKQFDDIEPELRRGFTGEPEGRYDSLRDFARHGYERGAGSATNNR